MTATGTLVVQRWGRIMRGSSDRRAATGAALRKVGNDFPFITERRVVDRRRRVRFSRVEPASGNQAGSAPPPKAAAQLLAARLPPAVARVRRFAVISERGWRHSVGFVSFSFLAHVAVIALSVAATTGAWQPERQMSRTNVVYLPPPDRLRASGRVTHVVEWGAFGGELEKGPRFTRVGGTAGVERQLSGLRRKGKAGGAKGHSPAGVPVQDSTFDVLQVEQPVERVEGSAAPVYPNELIASGKEGVVEATYVVDTMGRIDTTTFQVLRSDDARFTQSVHVALGAMLFRPAQRGGRSVRQLVGQRFRFRIMMPAASASASK